jgi:hypothetical protein
LKEANLDTYIQYDYNYRTSWWGENPKTMEGNSKKNQWLPEVRGGKEGE